MNYYILSTGRIVRDSDMSTAFEITTGLRVNDNMGMFKRWKNRISTISVESVPKVDDNLVRACVKARQFATAAIAYREIHRCTLSEAKEKIDNMMERRI